MGCSVDFKDSNPNVQDFVFAWFWTPPKFKSMSPIIKRYYIEQIDAVEKGNANSSSSTLSLNSHSRIGKIDITLLADWVLALTLKVQRN